MQDEEKAAQDGGQAGAVPAIYCTPSDKGPQDMELAALAYAARGWPVFPLCWPAPDGTCGCSQGHQGRDVGKAPLTPHGHHDATTDSAIISQWWEKWPSANVGLALERSGLLVVDADGPEATAEVEGLGIPPGTPVAETGGGGKHFYFAAPPGQEPRRVVGVGKSGKMDILGKGFVVLPPSAHRSGQAYCWIAPPGDRLPGVPAWVPEVVGARRRPVSGEHGEPVPEGRRNSTLTSLAGAMRRRGMTEAEIVAALRVVNARRCQPPLPDEEVEKIARSVAQYEPQPGNGGNGGGGREPIIVRAADVEPEDVLFLWRPYLPLGKLTILEGDPGIGKTWLALWIAANVTTGGHWPAQVLPETRPPANVLYLTAEDGVADTLRPRFDAAGGDPARLHVLAGWRDAQGNVGWTTLQDLPVLEGALGRVHPALLVVDPVQGFLGGIDAWRAEQVRPVLARLGDLARRYGCAVVLVRHLAKSAKDRAIYRGLGSIDFSAAARSVLLIGPDPSEKGLRHVVQVKSTCAPEGLSLKFTIEVGRLLWRGVSELTAADVLQPDQPVSERATVAEAADFLTEVLADGPRPAEEVVREARRCGISRATLRRAKEALRVRSVRESTPGQRGPGRWLWSLGDPALGGVRLPTPADQSVQAAPTPANKIEHLDNVDPKPLSANVLDQDAQVAMEHLDKNPTAPTVSDQDIKMLNDIGGGEHLDGRVEHLEPPTDDSGLGTCPECGTALIEDVDGNPICWECYRRAAIRYLEDKCRGAGSDGGS